MKLEEDSGKKTARVTLVKFACVESVYNGLKAGKTAVAQLHHKAFIAAMKEIATGENCSPAIGVIELLKKIFYVTYCDDDEKYGNLKMLVASVRDKVKNQLSSTNVDIQASDMDGLSYEYFAKQVKDI